MRGEERLLSPPRKASRSQHFFFFFISVAPPGVRTLVSTAYKLQMNNLDLYISFTTFTFYEL